MTSQKFAYNKGVNGHFEIAMRVANDAEIRAIIVTTYGKQVDFVSFYTLEPIVKAL